MHIESLELDNFKSFGNKRKVIFRKGFTVISGPNGSGKSNIGDSLLFVLGIRSSKAVRADRLPDLIHNASSPNKQRKSCSVTITIDTEKEDVPEDERFIKLARELVMDTESYHSVYYINNRRVKHSDVEQLLDTLRIYLDSYSFVLQGDINNFIKMTGMERRKLLESIAGIESFDNQIEKAKEDILRIESNLTKLEVLLEEYGRRMNQLRSEKESAEKYRELSEKIADLKVTMMNREVASVERDMESIEKQTLELNLEIDRIRDENNGILQNIENVKKEIEKVEYERDSVGNQELSALRKQMEEIRVKIAEFKMRVDDKKDEIKGQKETIEQNDEQIDYLNNQISDYRAKLENDQIKLREIKEEIMQNLSKLNELKSKTENRSKNINELQEKLRDKDSKIQELRVKIDERVELKNQLASQISAKNSELSNYEERRKNSEFQLKDAQWRLKNIENEETKNKGEFQRINQQYYALKNENDDLEKEKEDLVKKISELTREYDKLQLAIQGRKGPAQRALSTIMSARNEGRIQGIHGPVRELISFEDKFKNSIESAAGSRLNAVVVDDDQVAEECLSLLKREKAGKMTFLPLNKISLGRPRGKAIIVKGSEGSLGYVFERVEYRKEYEAAIWYAFQDTVIVKDVPTARKYMVGVRLVTLDGDIFEASGAITGGYSEKGSSLSDSEGKMSQLSFNIKELNERQQEVNIRLKENHALLENITGELRNKSKEEGANSAEIAQLTKTAEESRSYIEQFDKRITELNGELDDLKIRTSNEETVINELNDSLDLVLHEKEQVYGKLKQLSPEEMEEQNSMESKHEYLKGEEQRLENDITYLSTELKHSENKTNEVKTLNEDLRRKIKDLERIIEANESNRKESEATLEKYRIMESEMDAKSREFSEKIKSLQSSMEKFHDKVEGNKSLASTKHEIIISMSARLENLRSKKENIEYEIQQINGKVIEGKISQAEIRSLISESEKKILDLGPINHKAIEEYEIASNEFNRTAEEMSSLREEKKELEALTERLNEQKKVIFLRLFHDINKSMNEIYYVLSAGGEAQLILSNESDPLNSEVQIRARPKGSNFSKLEALSGGEKSLTALSFIMAVQRINPSPIYYLDEVDMFLDGANAERIGNMFRKNSQTSQILVVSLRKAMLKYADHIIGVTSFDDENTEVFEKSLDPEVELL